MKQDVNLIDYECEYALDLKLIAINENKKALLFEDNSGVENNGCNTRQLEIFFPEIDFDIYKQYFIQIDDEFLTGDKLDEYINQNMEY